MLLGLPTSLLPGGSVGEGSGLTLLKKDVMVIVLELRQLKVQITQLPIIINFAL